VLNAFRRNAAQPPTTTNFPPPPRRATTGTRGAPFNTATGRGRPPPPSPQPPPPFGADKYAAFTRPGAQQRDRAEEEAQKAQYDAMRGFRSMRNGHSQAYPNPPQPPRPSAHPTAPRPEINTPSAGVPPRHHRSYEHFQNMPQPGFPGMSRTASTRKPAGFAPNTPGGDEPMAQRTSAYAHYHSQRRESYFQEDDIPHSPTMARPEPATSPLRKSQSSADLDESSRRPQRPELNRISTRYAKSGGEKTYVNGVGRSASVRNSPVEREWEGHEDSGLHRPHSHHDSSTRHRSASPNFRPTARADPLSSSDSESSTDSEPENFASRPKAKLRPRRQKAGSGTSGFRYVAGDDPAMNSQYPQPNHKHPHSPQDEYTARYEYPPPPPRSDPRVFPEPQSFQHNGKPTIDDIRQHTRHVSSGDPKAKPNMYGTFHSPSRTWSEDWGFSPSKPRKAGPSLHGLPSWAVPSSVLPQQNSFTRKEPLEPISEENVGKTFDWFSHANPCFNQKLLSKADHVSSSSFSGVHESSTRPYPQPGYQSVSQEDINTTFSAADWDGKFNSGDEHFRPTEGREGKSPSRLSRTRRRSLGRGRTMSPNKDGAHSEPIDLTSDTDMPKAADPYDQNGADQPSKPTAQAFQPTKFSAEEWAAKLKDQTWAIPNSELSGSNPKPPKRPSRSTGGRRPTLSTKSDSDAAINSNSTIPPKFGSENAVPGLSDFGASTNGGLRAGSGPTGDAMDIDDSFSDTVPITPPTDDGAHHPCQPARANEIPMHSDVNLHNFAKVAPFAPSSTGLKDMDDLSTNLPFESRAAPALNLGKPVSSTSNLRLPKPPKSIIPPSEVNQLSWARYVADMNAYVCDWHVFNKRMIEHFRGRQEQVDMSMNSHWINMIGDGQPPHALDGRHAGYATYMAWLEEDDKCREWWNVANEKHRQCFEELGKIRAKVKAEPRLLHSDGTIW
jgi:hypothetical protein